MNDDAQQDESKQYLASLHAKIVTPDDIIREVVKEGTGFEVFDKKRIIAGEANEVYDITLTNNQHIILRISRNDHPDFLQEKWAIEQCKKIGIPVPEILFIKHLKIDGKQLSFCLMEKIAGEPLERGAINFDKLDLGLKKDLIKQAGEILAKIHSIPTQGFGWIINESQTEFSTSDQLITNLLNKSKHLEQIAIELTFDVNNITKALSIIEGFKDEYSKIQPRLNHADYSNKHFMVQNNKIISILDWGGVRSDSPVYDFANWDYWFGEQIPTEWLKEGYTNKDLFDENFDDILHMIRIFRGLEIFDWYHQQKRQGLLELIKAKLLKDLAYFKNL